MCIMTFYNISAEGLFHSFVVKYKASFDLSLKEALLLTIIKVSFQLNILI